LNSGIFAGIGLAAACGWNTFTPLLILALSDRITDGDLLDRPFDFISSLAGILVFLGLMTVELIADKVPRLDHALDVLGAVFRPATGALCFMAITHHDSSMHPILAMLFGLIIGGTVHWDKVRRRVRLAHEGIGLGTPFVSVVEDFASLITAACALLYGVLGPVAAVLNWLMVRATYRWGANFGKATIARARAGQTLRR
jgi:ABC-type xylose transport system permease subunit